MKNIILFTPILLILVSCGPSQKEKEEVAILTCNIMGESRNMDASLRIKEINVARKEIGEDRFLDTDEKIKESFEYGLCKELVLNDPDYSTKIRILEEERLRIEKEREDREEKRRLRIEKEREEERRQLAMERREKAQEEVKTFSKSCSNKIDKNLLFAGYITYQENCVACHQQNGEGIPPVFPSLSNLNITSDEYIEIMLNGIQGTAMQSYGHLSDEQIAAVISLNQNCWENKGEIVDPNKIFNLRK